MLRIFISYSRVDEQHAKKMYDSLAKERYSPWLDKVSLLPGQEWESEIKKAIRESHFFVLLLSKNSVDKRGYLQREIRFALDVFQTMPAGSIYLIPVRLDECHVPETLASIQWVDMFPNWDEGIKKICQSIYFQRSHEILSRPIEEQAPFPEDVRIVQPKRLDPKLASFSGYWSGRWGGLLPSQLAVEQIDSNKAKVVYTWGDDALGEFEKGWNRLAAKVLPSGTIRFGTKAKFTFRIDMDEDVIYGVRRVGRNDISEIVMRRTKV